MGNQLIKNYDIQKEANGVLGHQSLWKIYQGSKQDKTEKKVSICMIDKKVVMEKIHKQPKEDVCIFLRKEAQTLAKFKHPNVLNLVEPLLEDAKNMAFIVEEIQNSLQGLIIKNNIADLFPSELETKIHLLEIIQAINFFHNDVKMAHIGISPENILITNNGKWKLGGLIFATQLLTESVVTPNNIDFSNKSTDFVLKTQPNLNFCAPEICDIQSKCSFTSDIFSLGLVIYSLFKAKNDKNCNDIYLINSNNNLNQYKEKMINQQIVSKASQFIPQNLRNLWVKMMNPDFRSRPSINDVMSSIWFKDPFIQTISHIESLPQKELSQQQTFLKGLGKIILKFESKVIKNMILPGLIEYLKIEQLSPIILQIIVILMEQKNILPKDEFSQTVWPAIKTLTTGKEIPAQCLFLLLNNIILFCEVISNNDLQTCLMPLILKCYECGVVKLQEIALKNTEFLVKQLDFQYIKSKILPRVLKLCTDNSIELRRAALICLNKIYNLFDKNTQMEQIITTLEKMKKIGTDSKMNIIILNIYEGISKSLGIDVISTKILPHLVSYLCDLSLTKSEFKSYLSTIQNLLKKIEEERLPNLTNNSGGDDEFDMNKIMKDIDEIDQPSKKTNEIFSEMQGPALTNSDFDFLNIFDNNNSNSVPMQIQNQNSLSNSSNLDLNSGNKIAASIMTSNEKNEQKNEIKSFDFPSNFEKKNEQKNEIKSFDFPSNFEKKNEFAQDFFADIDKNIKPASMLHQSAAAPLKKPISSLNLNNQNQNKSSAFDNNNFFSNLNVKTNNSNQTNDLSNNFLNNNNNMNPIVFNNPIQNQSINQNNFIDSNNLFDGLNLKNNLINQPSSNKGNINKLNYDPFSEIDKPDNSNNPFGNDKNNFNASVKQNQPIDPWGAFNSEKKNETISNTKTIPGFQNNNFNINKMAANKPIDALGIDFFQNAIPKETNLGLKIKKLPQNFNHDDLI